MSVFGKELSLLTSLMWISCTAGNFCRLTKHSASHPTRQHFMLPGISHVFTKREKYNIIKHFINTTSILWLVTKRFLPQRTCQSRVPFSKWVDLRKITKSSVNPRIHRNSPNCSWDMLGPRPRSPRWTKWPLLQVRHFTNPLGWTANGVCLGHAPHLSATVPRWRNSMDWFKGKIAG